MEGASLSNPTTINCCAHHPEDAIRVDGAEPRLVQNTVTINCGGGASWAEDLSTFFVTWAEDLSTQTICEDLFFGFHLILGKKTG